MTEPDSGDDSRQILERALATARAEMSFRSSRSSGPGGQHAQRNETRIEAVLDIDSSSLDAPAKERLRERFGSAVRAVAQDERSQLRNRELAQERLLEKLRWVLTPERERRPTRPSRQARLRRLLDKRRRGSKKQLRRPPSGSEE
ncbi:MAG: peptide chain release factor-like protein [Gaiellaceae bacterium]